MLTVKQEKFAQCVADGMTQSDAYRTAYDTSNMKDASIWRKATEVMDNIKVFDRVAELKAKTASKALWTREMSIKALVRAYKDGAPSAKIQAVKELNLMHGYNAPQKLDHTSSDGSMSPNRKLTPEEIEAEMVKRGLPLSLLGK